MSVVCEVSECVCVKYVSVVSECVCVSMQLLSVENARTRRCRKDVDGIRYAVTLVLPLYFPPPFHPPPPPLPSIYLYPPIICLTNKDKNFVSSNLRHY